MKFTRLGDRFINVDKITYVDFSGGLNKAKIFFSAADNLRSSQAADFLALNPAEAQMLLSFLEETLGSQITLEEPVNPNQLSFEMLASVPIPPTSQVEPTQTNEIEEEVILDTTQEIGQSSIVQAIPDADEQANEDEDARTTTVESDKEAELEDIEGDEQATIIEEVNVSEEVVAVDDEVELVEEVASVEGEAELDQQIVGLEDDPQTDEEIEQLVDEVDVFDEPPPAPTPPPAEDPNKHSFSRRNQVTYLR